MLLAGVRIHRIVCTAFYGPPSQPNMVVDHIDTNRCNNRPDNLRWVTRLENALDNPVTRKKIEYYCGSVEAFLKNPVLLRDTVLPPNLSWMRTVSKEEADACRKRMDEWATTKSVSISKTVSTAQKPGDWLFTENIFSDEEINEAKLWSSGMPIYPFKSWREQVDETEKETRRLHLEALALKDSLTPGAKQLNWITPTAFPLCPVNGERTLSSYLKYLTPGARFTENRYGTGSLVEEAGYNAVEDVLYVLGRLIDNANPLALCRISFKGGEFIHENIRSYESEIGGHKYFTLAMGQKWTGGDCIDDYNW